MEEIMKIDAAKLVHAVNLYTGYKHDPAPSIGRAARNKQFAESQYAGLKEIIEKLEGEFYLSKAYQTAEDLSTMGKQARKEFNKKFPFLDDQVSEAFSWCYTFDYK